VLGGGDGADQLFGGPGADTADCDRGDDAIQLGDGTTWRSGIPVTPQGHR